MDLSVADDSFTDDSMGESSVDTLADSTEMPLFRAPLNLDTSGLDEDPSPRDVQQIEAELNQPPPAPRASFGRTHVDWSSTS